jgi:hypothetical protein
MNLPSRFLGDAFDLFRTRGEILRKLLEFIVRIKKRRNMLMLYQGLEETDWIKN